MLINSHRLLIPTRHTGRIFYENDSELSQMPFLFYAPINSGTTAGFKINLQVFYELKRAKDEH